MFVSNMTVFHGNKKIYINYKIDLEFFTVSIEFLVYRLSCRFHGFCFDVRKFADFPFRPHSFPFLVKCPNLFNVFQILKKKKIKY